MTKRTQGRRIIERLKRRPMTSMQIQMLGISTCWWKRVAESLHEDEQLVRFQYVKNRTSYGVVPRKIK